MKSPAPRAGTTLVILVLLACGAFLVTAALAVLLRNVPTPAVAPRGVVSASEILITAVPTVSHPLVPQPTRMSDTGRVSQNVQPLAELSDGLPVFDQAPALPTIPGPLVDPSLSLYTGPVSVPLEIQIPALQIKAPVDAVGLSLTNAMSSPRGSVPEDPIWQTIFWYRGGGIPGNAGTATLAGHYDDMLGRPAVFAYLEELYIGDVIIVRDQRSGVEIPFIVTETTTYTNEESADPAVLARVFGESSVRGAAPQAESDPFSHLTLITCGGSWINGMFNLRLVVYAIRASYPF